MRLKLPFAAMAFCMAASGAAQAGDKAWNTFSDAGAVGLPLAALAITAFHDDDEGYMPLGETLLTSAVLTLGLKHFVTEDRPNGRDDKSFPSTHASAAFAGAGYIHARYGWEWGLPATLLATGVAYARVEAREHHWYDVAVSAIISEVAAFAWTDAYNLDVRVLPFTDTAGRPVGLVAQMDF